MTENLSSLSCDCQAFKVLPLHKGLTIFLTKWNKRVKKFIPSKQKALTPPHLVLLPSLIFLFKNEISEYFYKRRDESLYKLYIFLWISFLQYRWFMHDMSYSILTARKTLQCHQISNKLNNKFLPISCHLAY